MARIKAIHVGISRLYLAPVYHKIHSLTAASTLIPGGRSLRPVKNRAGSFNKVVDQNFPPIFTGQITLLTNKLPPAFLLPPIFFHYLL